MNKKLFTLITIFIVTLSTLFSFDVNAVDQRAIDTKNKAATDAAAKTKAAADAKAKSTVKPQEKGIVDKAVDGVIDTLAPDGSLLATLIPSKKNCNFVDDKLYQPFSDIDEKFPGASTLGLVKSKKDPSVTCIKVEGGTEALLKMLFTVAISIIIILAVINISISGIQYMTQEAVGKKGEAKKRLQNSLIALALGLMSYAILYTVNKQLVSFEFNPSGLDVDGSIDKGIASANRDVGTYSTGVNIEPIGKQTNPLFNYYNQTASPTGWVNPYTQAPCTPTAEDIKNDTDTNQLIPNTQPEPLAFLKNTSRFIASTYQIFAVETFPTNITPDTGTGLNKKGGCVKQKTLAETYNQGTGTPTPGTGIVAQLTTKNGNTGEGAIYVEGVPYSFKSGPWGNGYLPVGTYTVTYGDYSIQGVRGRREEPKSMTVPAPSTYSNSMFGYSFNLNDKTDPRKGGITRTELRIHPDGGVSGTAGCIGIIGDLAVQERFFNQLSQFLAKNGGSYTLTVN